MTPERSASHVGSPLGWLDKAILAATALAACILVIPGLSLLVDDARKTHTVRKLGKVGGTLQKAACVVEAAAAVTLSTNMVSNKLSKCTQLTAMPIAVTIHGKAVCQRRSR